jgi:hypothetical protein
MRWSDLAARERNCSATCCPAARRPSSRGAGAAAAVLALVIILLAPAVAAVQRMALVGVPTALFAVEASRRQAVAAR